MSELKIPYTQLVDMLQTILFKVGFSKNKAHLCAELFSKASLDGVASHGLNRFPSFLKMIEDGFIDIGA